MSIVNIKLSDGDDGLNVFVQIDVVDFDKESISIALGERVQDYLNGIIADAHKQDHPLLPKKELILPVPAIYGTQDYTGLDIVAYSEQQMRSYAAQEVAAAREQWEKQGGSK